MILILDHLTPVSARYFMPGYLNEEGIDIPVNTKLSKLDKAFIVLNYPPVLDTQENLHRLMQAMIDAGVTNKAAGEILAGYKNPDPDGPAPAVAARLNKVQELFSAYNKRSMDLRTCKWVIMKKMYEV